MLNSLKRLIFGEETRLRHLYQFAIIIEEQGAQYYDKLAKQTKNEALTKLCFQLVEEENEHKRLFQQRLSRWVPLPLDDKSLDRLERKFQTKGIFSDLTLSDKTVDDLVRYAIAVEHKSIDFYLSFEKDFPDAWKSMQLSRIIEEERSHAERLSLFLSSSGKSH